MKKPDIYPAINGRKVKVPVTVVIDDGSASASEILAGALKRIIWHSTSWSYNIW